MQRTMLPDVNVLLAAHRSDHPHHAAAAKWLAGTLDNAASRLLLAMPVIGGFIRLATNPRVFLQPSSAASAVDFVDWLLENDRVALHGGASEWPAFRRIVLERQLAANAVPDAWLAALSLGWSEPFVTFDKGFRKLLPRNLLVLLTPA